MPGSDCICLRDKSDLHLLNSDPVLQAPPVRQADASANGSDAGPAATHGSPTEDVESIAGHTAPADEPETGEEAMAAAAHAAFAEEEVAEDATAMDWDGDDDGGFGRDGLGGVSEEEHTDRGWGVYAPIAAAIDAGRKVGRVSHPLLSALTALQRHAGAGWLCNVVAGPGCY